MIDPPARIKPIVDAWCMNTHIEPTISTVDTSVHGSHILVVFPLCDLQMYVIFVNNNTGLSHSHSEHPSHRNSL